MRRAEKEVSPRLTRPGTITKSNQATDDFCASVPERIDGFLHDALLEVILTAERRWWLRRAEDFERARPRVDDHFGNLTRDEVRAQWHRLTEMANACRARAHVSPVEHIREDVENVLREAS